jgi:hypothetical protein
MKLQTLEDLFLHELKDLYSAENQLVKALPEMAQAATNPELKAGFQEHLEQTKGHVERLTKIGEQLGKKLTGHTCKAMEGLVEEGAELIDEMRKRAFAMPVSSARRNASSITKSPATAPPALSRPASVTTISPISSRKRSMRKRKPTRSSPNSPNLQ